VSKSTNQNCGFTLRNFRMFYNN